MHLNAKSCLYIHTHILYSSASEQLLQVDVQQGLPPVTEGAVLRQDKGLVLLFAQQREHVLHQLTESAVTVTSQGQRIHSEVCMKKGHNEIEGGGEGGRSVLFHIRLFNFYFFFF